MTTTNQRADEARELARTGFDELGRAMAGIGGVHLAVAERVFRAVGPTGRPARTAHDIVSKGVYAALRGGAGAIGAGAGAAVALRRGAEASPLSETRAGSLVIGALNGLYGDTMEREGSALAQPMTVRVRGRAVPLEPDALAAAFPHARGRIVVFVHGLMETEHGWRLRAERTGGSYGDRLAEDLCVTPVDIRYNTGRHISENGAALGELLEELTAAWPAPVREIAIVGTRWAAWSPAARATARTRRAPRGCGACATSSRWARRTWARRWRRASTTSATP